MEQFSFLYSILIYGDNSLYHGSPISFSFPYPLTQQHLLNVWITHSPYNGEVHILMEGETYNYDSMTITAILDVHSQWTGYSDMQTGAQEDFKLELPWRMGLNLPGK